MKEIGEEEFQVKLKVIQEQQKDSSLQLSDLRQLQMNIFDMDFDLESIDKLESVNFQTQKILIQRYMMETNMTNQVKLEELFIKRGYGTIIEWFAHAQVRTHDIQEKGIYSFLLNELKVKFDQAMGGQQIQLKQLAVNLSKYTNLQLTNIDQLMQQAEKSQEMCLVVLYQSLMDSSLLSQQNTNQLVRLLESHKIQIGFRAFIKLCQSAD